MRTLEIPEDNFTFDLEVGRVFMGNMQRDISLIPSKNTPKNGRANES